MNAPDEDVAVQDGVPRTASSRHLGQSLAPAEDGHKPGNDDHVVCERNLSTLLANLADQTSRADAAEAENVRLKEAIRQAADVHATSRELERIVVARAAAAEAKLARVLSALRPDYFVGELDSRWKKIRIADLDAALADPKA